MPQLEWNNMSRLAFRISDHTRLNVFIGQLPLVFLIAFLGSVTGCDSSKFQQTQAVPISPKLFDVHGPVRYKLSLQRETTIQFSAGNTLSPNGPQLMIENLETIFTTRLVSEEPDKVSCEITCESVDARRRDFTNTSIFYDALKSLEGKSYTMTISNEGQWLNRQEVESLFQKAAEHSISLKGKRRIKRPDFVADFVAINHRIVSESLRIRKASNLAKDQTWTTRIPTAWSYPDAGIPDTVAECRVQDVRTEEGIRKVHIDERYSLGTSSAVSLPNPYAGEHTLEGLLGFLRNVRFDSLTGEGQKVLTQTAGVVEQSREHRAIKGRASLSIPVDNPDTEITIDETIEIRRIVELEAK